MKVIASSSQIMASSALKISQCASKREQRARDAIGVDTSYLISTNLGVLDSPIVLAFILLPIAMMSGFATVPSLHRSKLASSQAISEQGIQVGPEFDWQSHALHIRKTHLLGLTNVPHVRWRGATLV
jgi:hypothetical protein